jgi:hypothetical protein
MKARQVCSMVLGCTAAAAVAAGCTPLEDNVATTEEVSGITVTFASTAVAQHSGRCVDVFGVGTGNDVNLVQWNCHSGTN